MTSLTLLCEMACQVVQKKLEEKQLEEERAAKAQNWKLPVCYDDDDDEERSDFLSDNIISGLLLFSAITPNEPVLSTEEPDNSLNTFEDFSESNEEFSSTDDDSFSFDKIDYVEASPPDSELVSSKDDHSPLLAYVVWIFVAYLTYPIIPPYLYPFGNEDTIFDPGITINQFYSFKPCLSHRHEAFKKFNTHRSHLNEWPMTINGKNTHLLDVLLFHFYPP
nr:hypothetical protein [Tanacetum cinerariifolium]